MEENQIGRFYPLYSPKTPTSTEKNSLKSIQIFVQNDNIHIVSTDSNPIEIWVIYNLIGRALLQQHNTGKNQVVIPVAGLSPIIIVKANTSKMFKTSKLNL